MRAKSIFYFHLACVLQCHPVTWPRKDFVQQFFSKRFFAPDFILNFGAAEVVLKSGKDLRQ